MIQDQQGSTGTVWLGAVAVLFGILLLASQANELLKQIVIAPGTAAELGIAANCRADELVEEALSLRECQLMVSSVQITLASSPEWFRPFQIGLSIVGCIGAAVSLLVGFGLVNGFGNASRWGVYSFSLLVLLDIVGFIAAVNIGPLLRAQYLSPLMLWFFIHLCLLVATFHSALASTRAEE